MWEDGFCRGRGSSSGCVEDIDGEDLVRKAFSKMSIQLYNYGEGWVLGRSLFVCFLLLLLCCVFILSLFFFFSNLILVHVEEVTTANCIHKHKHKHMNKLLFFVLLCCDWLNFMLLFVLEQVDGESCI